MTHNKQTPQEQQRQSGIQNPSSPTPARKAGDMSQRDTQSAKTGRDDDRQRQGQGQGQSKDVSSRDRGGTH